MSIASVFSFVFETQGAKKVTSEIQHMTKEEREAYKESQKLAKEQENLKKKNLDLAKSLAETISAYVGFKKILSEVLGFARGGEDLLLMAKSAGIAADQLERYGIALQNYGGGLSSAASTLSNLNQQMQDLKFGKGGAIQEAAIRYGVSLHGRSGLATGEEMLFNIARRMESLGTQEQLDLGRKLGLDPASIAMLQNGVAGLNAELAKAAEFTLYSDEDIENTRKFQLALRELQLSFQQVWGVLSRALLPTFTFIAKGVRNVFSYIKDHKALVLGFFGGIAVALGLIAIKALIAWAALLGPILPIVIGITAIGAAIGLVIDDFVAFMQGGKSCIGFVIKYLKDLLELIYFICGAIGEGLYYAFSGIADAVSRSWDALVAKVTGILAWIAEKWQTVKSWIPFLGDEADVAITGQEALNSTQTPLSTMATSNVMNSSSNSVKIDTVSVNTQATDAQGISRGISGALQTEFEDVLSENTGGAVA